MFDLDKPLQEIINKKDIFKDELMSKHTSLRIGGKADYFIVVRTVDELKSVIGLLTKKNIPYIVIGNGTNLLVRDGGIRGAVIKIELNNFRIKKNQEDIFITVESGMSLAALAAICLKEEYEGVEFLSGIPGTIGGAVRMNAGAYGFEMKDIVVNSRYMTKDGKIKKLNSKEHCFEYRNSVFSKIDGILIDTTIKCHNGSKELIETKMKEYKNKRLSSQPLEYPSAGSTFKRKDNVLTAKLIDEAGLKGFSIGDAEVSEKHAGFLINKGKATAKEFLELVEYVKKVIKEKFNEDIELEILVIGEK